MYIYWMKLEQFYFFKIEGRSQYLIQLFTYYTGHAVTRHLLVYKIKQKNIFTINWN